MPLQLIRHVKSYSLLMSLLIFCLLPACSYPHPECLVSARGCALLLTLCTARMQLRALI